MSGGATQAATPRLRPPAPDTHPPGGARDGELSRLRRPPVRRLDPAYSGSHRAAGGSGASHRARLHCSDLPGVPTALHTSGGTGRRGPGPAAPRRQPTQPDRHAAGRGAAAHPQRPVVSGHRASVAPQRAQPAVAAILDRIRASPVVHADETGWRQSGANGYVWTFSTPTERYFLRRGRGKTVVDQALSDSCSGVLVSDFYAAYHHAAYHHYDGPKQRC